jgi:hypothetical protein
MLEFHLILSTALIMLDLLTIVMIKEVLGMRLSFKVLIGVLVILSIVYEVIFFYALNTLIFNTSFLMHIRDGDLLAHLAKAMPLF